MLVFEAEAFTALFVWSGVEAPVWSGSGVGEAAPFSAALSRACVRRARLQRREGLPFFQSDEVAEVEKGVNQD